jgi:Glycosyltransferases involved in cell wall biogenesis
MQLRTLAVVMPAYNEAEGLPSFLREVLDAVRPLASTVQLVVVNDRSTDETSVVLGALRSDLPELTVIDSPVNRGHGPTALAAYRAGLESNPDAVLHVDGDGQFLGEDLPRVIRALDDADVVHGVRGGRTDPWFRRTLTACVGGAVALVVRERIPDVNTPLRAYRADTLRRLLDAVPPDALVPHVQFSIAEARLGIRRKYVRVRSIPRRGSTETGTMWGATERTPKLPPKRLLVFSARAAREVWTYSVLRRPSADRVAPERREDAYRDRSDDGGSGASAP